MYQENPTKKFGISTNVIGFGPESGFLKFVPEYIILGGLCQWRKCSPLNFTKSLQVINICWCVRYRYNISIYKAKQTKNYRFWSNLGFEWFFPEYLILGRCCQWRKRSTQDLTICYRENDICIFDRHRHNLVLNLGVKWLVKWLFRSNFAFWWLFPWTLHFK